MVVLVVSYAIALHLLISSFAAGALAALAPFDGPAAVICTPGAATPASDQPSGHRPVADCCAAGCQMFAPLLAPLPADSVACIWNKQDIGIVLAPEPRLLPLEWGRSSGHPRAPPLMS